MASTAAASSLDQLWIHILRKLLLPAMDDPVDHFHSLCAEFGKRNIYRGKGRYPHSAFLQVIKAGNADLLRHLHAPPFQFFTDGKRLEIIGADNSPWIILPFTGKPVHNFLSVLSPVVSFVDHMLRHFNTGFFHHLQKARISFPCIQIILLARHKANIPKAVVIDKMSGHLLHGLFIFNADVIYSFLWRADINHRTGSLFPYSILKLRSHSNDVKGILRHDQSVHHRKIRQCNDPLLSLCIQDLISIGSKICKNKHIIIQLFGLCKNCF